MSTEPLPTTSGPPRTITLFTATCIVIANMIGTAVFVSLGFQVGGLPSGFSILVLWLVGGVCALCGALAYGELAAALPRSGGEYHFLSVIYHPAAGFLAGWISITVGFAAPVAFSAMAFTSYFQAAFPSDQAVWVGKAFSIGLVAIVTAVHLRGNRAGGRFQDAATILKVLLILVMIGAGLTMAHAQPVSFLPAAHDSGLIFSSAFAGNLVYVMYAYSGWNATVYIVGEVREPGRNVPLSVVIGTLVVMVLYVLLNVVMLLAAPMSELGRNPVAAPAAAVAAQSLFGALGGRVISGLIGAGLVASVSAMIFTGPRVSMAMGEDWPILRFLARKSARGIPATALLVQSGITCLLILSMTFEAVTNYIGFSLSVCSFFTVLGIYVLRLRQPHLPRPARAWGYPVTPLIFLAVNAWMLYQIMVSRPKESLAGLATMAAGLLVYALSPKSGAPAEAR